MKSSITNHKSALHRLLEAMGLENARSSWPVTMR